MDYRNYTPVPVHDILKYKEYYIMVGGGGSSEVMNFILYYDKSFNFIDKSLVGDACYTKMNIVNNILIASGMHSVKKEGDNFKTKFQHIGLYVIEKCNNKLSFAKLKPELKFSMGNEKIALNLTFMKSEIKNSVMKIICGYEKGLINVFGARIDNKNKKVEDLSKHSAIICEKDLIYIDLLDKSSRYLCISEHKLYVDDLQKSKKHKVHSVEHPNKKINKILHVSKIDSMNFAMCYQALDKSNYIAVYRIKRKGENSLLETNDIIAICEHRIELFNRDRLINFEFNKDLLKMYVMTTSGHHWKLCIDIPERKIHSHYIVQDTGEFPATKSIYWEDQDQTCLVSVNLGYNLYRQKEEGFRYIRRDGLLLFIIVFILSFLLFTGMGVFNIEKEKELFKLLGLEMQETLDNFEQIAFGYAEWIGTFGNGLI